MSTDDEAPADDEQDAEPRGALAELRAFLAENKAWWIAPIVILLVVIVGVVVVATTGVGPYIYTFF